METKDTMETKQSAATETETKQSVSGKKSGGNPLAFIIAIVAIVGIFYLTTPKNSTQSSRYSSSTSNATSTTKTESDDTASKKDTPKEIPVEKPVSTSSTISSFVNSQELNTLKTNILAAGSNLDQIVASGDTEQLQIRRSLVWSALREFESLEVPTACRTMRDYYVWASESLVHALDYYTDYFSGNKNDGTLANAITSIEEATEYLNTAMDEESKLK